MRILAQSLYLGLMIRPWLRQFYSDTLVSLRSDPERRLAAPQRADDDNGNGNE